jgi:hypothetical protein
MHLNDLLALTLLALLWLTVTLILWRSLRGSHPRPVPVVHSVLRLRRTDLRNHNVHAWPAGNRR